MLYILFSLVLIIYKIFLKLYEIIQKNDKNSITICIDNYMETKINLRTHQSNAIHAIYKSFDNYNKCLVKMFCGTGKSRIIFHMMMNNNNNLSVIVFPSISLITQFNTDYIQNREWNGITKNYKYLSICSKNELQENTHNINYTTDDELIINFLNNKEKKIVCVTYQSFETFVKCINDLDINIDLIEYDEAHHIVGSKIQQLVFNNNIFNKKCIKTVFFTATPKNENGITMLERDYNDINYELINEDDNDKNDIPYKTDCGTLAFEYTHYQAVQDGICNDYDIAIDFYTDNSYKYKSVYSAISRCIFSTGNKKCLTFHARSEVETDNGSYVMDFTSDENKLKFKKEYDEVLQTEFKEIIGEYKDKLIINGLTGKTKNKQKVLNEFDKDCKNVRVLASCNTIGEGIDTKNANIACFVDPRTSHTTITQNIGRVCRIQKQKSTVLIPCYVDVEKYKNCKTDEERDLVIREDMNKDGNYNSILNTLSALRQEDPESYDLCLHYPKSYAPKEIKNNLQKQGYKIEEEVGNLDETIDYLVDDCDIESIKDTNDIEEKAKIIDKKIIINSTSMEEPIKTYNSEAKDNIVIYHNEENDEYRPVTKKDGVKQAKNIKAPNRKKININVHANKDVKVLWKIEGDFDLDKMVCQVYINSTIVENKWEKRLEEVKEFIDTNKNKPSSMSKNNDEKVLGKWIGTQQTNYQKRTQIMKDDDIYNTWTQFINDPLYKEYFQSNEETWYITLSQVKEFIDSNKKRPSNHSKNKDEKVLGTWIGNQQTNYKKRTNIMKDDDIYNTWTQFINDPLYKEHFQSNEETWYITLSQVKEFIDLNKKRLSTISKNKDEKVLGTWIGTQQKNYKKRTNIMKDDDIYNTWAQFINDPLYKEHVQSKEETWYIKLSQVKEFIDANKKRPSERSKNKDEKILGSWIVNQQKNYQKRTNIMKDDDIYNTWTQFINDPLYKEYFRSNEDVWSTTLSKVKEFIYLNKKRPSKTSKNKDEKVLEKWIGHQQTNYKKRTNIMKDDDIRKIWGDFVTEYSSLFDTSYLDHKVNILENSKNVNSNKIKVINKKTISTIKETPDKQIISKPTIEQKTIKPTKSIKINISKKLPKNKEDVEKVNKQRNKAKLSELHQKYKTMNSNNLNKLFNEQPELWKEYHDIVDKNEEGFIEQDEIPYKRIIKYLENMKTKRNKYIADLGCGKARISKYFENNGLFKFYNYDHYAENETVKKCDISNLPLDDDEINIAIMSLCMWGSNCKDYIKEAHRVLEDNGVLVIIEPTKRWIEENGENRLEKLLTENNFQIKKNHNKNDHKFMFLECIKN